MPQWVERGTLLNRLRDAKTWRDHQCLLFESIHTPDTTLLKSLLVFYRERLNKQPTPLLRWAYANCTCEISSLFNAVIVESGTSAHQDTNRKYYRKYHLESGDYLKEQDAVAEFKRVTKEAPTQVIGYLGLARAYSMSFQDEELLRYTKAVKKERVTVKDVKTGKPIQAWSTVATNPEMEKRYRLLLEKIKKIDPENPFIYFWEAGAMMGAYVHDRKAIDFSKGFELCDKAYRLGMEQLSPTHVLGRALWFACKANRKADVERYAKELRQFIAKAPESICSAWLRTFLLLSDCPSLKTLLR